MADQSQDRKALAGSAKSGFKKLSLRSIITYFLQLVSTLVLSKCFLPRDYGIFGILQNWLGSGNYLTDIGLTDGLTQQKEEISKEQLSAFLFIRLSLATVVAIAFFIGLYFFQEELGLEPGKEPLMYFLGVFAIFDVLNATPKMQLQKAMNFGALAKVELVASIFLYTAQISLALLGVGYWSMFAGFLLRYFVIIFYGSSKNFFTLPRMKYLKTVRKLFRKGLFYQLHLVAVFFVGIITPILLKKYLTRDKVGIYFWSVGLVSIPMGIIFNFQNVVFPAISKIQDNQQEVKILFNRGSELFMILVFGIFGLGAASAPGLINILFDQKWYEAKEIIGLVAFLFASYSIRQIPLVLLTSLGLSAQKFFAELLFLISMGLGAIVLIPRFGLLGFIYGSILGHVISFIFALLCSRNFYSGSFYRHLITLILGTVIPFGFLTKFELLEKVYVSAPIFLLGMFLITALLDFDLIKTLKSQVRR